MSMGAAWRIVIGQTIDERDLRTAANYGGNIDYFRAADFQHRNDLELLQYILNFGRVLRLQRANDDVLTSLAAATAFVQHLKGFADSGGVAEENFQTAAPFAKLLPFAFRE